MEWIDWVDFGSGFIVASLFFAIISSNRADYDFELDGDDYRGDFSGRRKEISCQTCRKLKAHIEIEKDLWICTKCKRPLDLRIS